MAVSAYKSVWKSPSKGNARLVELAMADHVIEERLQAGFPAEVWASQSTLAAMCGCSRSTVERALEELKRLGRIVDTGKRKHGKYRGTVVYELVLTDTPDLTQSDVTQNGPALGVVGSDLTHFENDLTHSADDLTHFEQRPASPMTHKQGVKQVVKPETKQGPAPESPGVISSSENSEDLREATLHELRALLPDCKMSSLRESTERRIEKVEGELDCDAEILRASDRWLNLAAAA